MTAGVVYDLELVQVEVQKRVGSFARFGALERTLDAIFEFPPVYQARQDIVAGVIAQAAVEVPGLTDIVENQHTARNAAAAVSYRRRRAFDVKLVAIASYQQRRSHRLDGAIPANRYRQRILQGFAGLLVKTAKDLVNRPAACVVDLPAGKSLCNGIDILDVAIRIGSDHAVTDRLQRNLRALFLAKKGIFVELSVGNVHLDAEQPLQATVTVDDRFGSALHPAPFTILVLHAMDRLEKRRVAFKVLPHPRLHARHVVRMNKPIPVQRYLVIIGVVAEHALPAARQIDMLRLAVKIPDAVVSRHRNQGIALGELVQHFLVRDAFQANRGSRPEQLHQQVQVRLPAVNRPFVDDSEKSRNPVAHRESDNESRTDMQLMQALEFVFGGARTAQGIRYLDDAKMPQAPQQPRPVVYLLTGKHARIAARKSAARCKHGLESSSRRR